MTYKLGSLFDGSGGFPLAGALCGIAPTWAAEVEPYPIAVTRSRFPNMKHLGDISKVNGADIEPVDVITFGSPCQDLSVAGKRAGLKHEANGDEETTRSGLFMEAVRIIKEMRSATNGEYPRFALWENVPGAFSSNKGEDFRIVCEELIKIVEPSAFMPSVPQKGWPYADSYVGDGWSLAYRVFDAQYWGVPQRRRRIHLVVDFRGECAREILFEREGVRGYFETSRTPWQAIASHAEGSFGADDREGESTGGARGRQLDAVAYTLKVRSGCDVDSAGKAAGKGALVQTEKAATLACVQDQYLFQPTAILDNIGGQAEYGKVTQTNGTLRAGAQGAVAYVVENHPADSRVDLDETGKVQTLTSRMGTGGGNVPMVMEPMAFAQNQRDELRDLGDKAGALQAQPGMKQQTFVAEPVVYDGAGITSPVNASNPQPGDPCHTLSTDSRNLLVEPVFCLQGNGIDRADSAGCNGKGVAEDVGYTLNTIDRHAVAFGIDQGATRDVGKLFIEEASKTLTNGSCPGHHNGVVVAFGLDRASFNQGQNAQFGFSVLEESQPTLVASGPNGVAHPTYTASKASFFTRGACETADCLVATDYKDPPIINAVQGVRYIVRRLTPTECARLQGFADQHGHLEQKTDLTDEEYSFWLEVRNTHATINGKAVKGYTKAQMLTWYNKLWTDAAEYKMWGNGIALPPALYCMQGITDVLNREEEDAWLL
jgi:DNA (cytosine-5)-methyltransferase 1